jgi:hypothetical protein
MLTTIQENVTVGHDGLIQLHAHGLKYNTKLSVVAVIETQKTDIEDDWQLFIEKTAGSLNKMPIYRATEINFEKRAELL